MMPSHNHLTEHSDTLPAESHAAPLVCIVMEVTRARPDHVMGCCTKSCSMPNVGQSVASLHACVLLYMRAPSAEAYSVDVWGKLAGEDEAVNALLQAWDVHDLHKVAFNSA